MKVCFLCSFLCVIVIHFTSPYGINPMIYCYCLYFKQLSVKERRKEVLYYIKQFLWSVLLCVILSLPLSIILQPKCKSACVFLKMYITFIIKNTVCWLHWWILPNIYRRINTDTSQSLPNRRGGTFQLILWDQN